MQGIQEEIKTNQTAVGDATTAIVVRHGGARTGAGRKPMDLDPRHVAARSGITPLRAGIILDSLIDARAQWLRVFKSTDDRVILDALKFLTMMREGKPAQQINVTNQSLIISAHDISEARAIIAELRHGLAQPTFALPSPRTEGEPSEDSPSIRGEDAAKPNV